MARFNSFLSGGNSVNSEMFGSNALYDINTLTDGTIREGYLDAIMQSGTQNIRFPGGLVEIDFNVMRMDNGALRAEVINFFDDLREINFDGADVSVTIVLPTQSFIPTDEYRDFVREVSAQYGDLVSGFELGNEYSLGARNPDGLFSGHPEGALVRPTEFGISEVTYGQQVQRIAVAVEQGIRMAISDDPQFLSNFDPDILMQISDIVGAASSFRGTNDHGAADMAILSQISPSVMALIDGFVGHYYYNNAHQDSELFDGLWRETRSFPERIESWHSSLQERFGSSFSHNDISFTEWNTNIRTHDQHGLKAGSILAKQFEYMIEMGADSAFVWPLQHNTNTSIAGHFSDSIADLSPAGRVFATLNELLNPNLNDGTLFGLSEVSFSWLDQRLDVAGYNSEYESVFVISNRSGETVSENIHFANGFGSVVDGTLYTIGIETSSSDGLAMGGNDEGRGRIARRTIDVDELRSLQALPFFDAGNLNHIKLVNGVYKTYLLDASHYIPKFSGAQTIDEFWVVTEPDVSGSLLVDDGALSTTDDWVDLQLNPYEIAIVHVEHSRDISGTEAHEVIHGGVGADSVLARGGDDSIFGYSGDDTLKGGWGNDTLDGGEGDNYLVGSVGDDTFIMSSGQSTVSGGDGIDSVDYSNANPSILVDLLFERINARDAEGDSFTGVENLIGTRGADNIRGTLENNQLFGGDNVDYIFGRRGNDTLTGGIGDDVLFGGVGADVLNGGEHRDRAQYSESLSPVRVDLVSPHTNTGEAYGDVFVSIEDLAGSRFGDSLFGDNGNNRLFGREGNDSLLGRYGDDYLNGGSGDDLLIGGHADDILRGGTGADVFVFSEGHDVIEDFNLLEDSLEIHNSAFDGFDAGAVEAVNGNVLVHIDQENSITLLGISLVQFGDHFGFS